MRTVIAVKSSDGFQQARSMAGYTQSSLAKKVGASANHLACIERGEGGPKPELARKILDAINDRMLKSERLRWNDLWQFKLVENRQRKEPPNA